MNLTKEKRYKITGFYKPFEVEVLVNEFGEVQAWRDASDSYYEVAKENDLFFQTLEEAQAYRQSIIPEDLDKYKEYVEYVFECDEECDLKELLPEQVYNLYLKGFKAYHILSYQELQKIKKAIKGLIEVGSYTFKSSEVARICYLREDRIEVKLTGGEVLTSTDETEQMILRSVFGENCSGRITAR